eukprot:100385-Chlamydomonas_euryale.AAC.14
MTGFTGAWGGPKLGARGQLDLNVHAPRHQRPCSSPAPISQLESSHVRPSDIDRPGQPKATDKTRPEHRWCEINFALKLMATASSSNRLAS